MQEPSFVLLSLHPKHAKKILSGEKKLEFRRVWATRPVVAIVIYATVPVQKIVAIAKVKQIHHGSPSSLWSLASEIGGGLSRRELYAYYKGRKKGFALELECVKRFPSPLIPSAFIKGFRAPQSFSYVDRNIFSVLEKEFELQSHEGRVLFVSGVHGVGKTTMCENYANAHGIVHKSASQLIREAKESALAGTSKAVKDIAGNQELLIQAVRQYRSSGQTLLLDGHFALLDVEHKPQALATKIFAELGIDGVVLIQDTPQAIASRIASRDMHPISAQGVAELQAVESSRAMQVTDDLCIPFFKVRSLDQSDFDQAIDALSI